MTPTDAPSGPFAPLRAAAIRAADAILQIYRSDFRVETKSDGSPITAADRAAHAIIVAALNPLPPPWNGLPILSEEGRIPDWNERRRWSRYWLVDPLDGTREFVARSGEFTVNIALIEHHRPVLGIIQQPTAAEGWYAAEGRAWAFDATTHTPIACRRHEPPVVIGSRRHGLAEFDHAVARIGAHQRLQAGSSLKFCRVAAGIADVCLRFGVTSEWDTAAGQAIVAAAGGSVTDLEGRELEYNRRESLHNPPFIAGNAGAGVWAQRIRSH